jgi:phosphoglycolate phosphatase-like HAD superfamily hydrolase
LIGPQAAGAVLWDLDGTLVDSAELHWISWRDTLAAEGHSITYQQFLDSFGQKNDRILPGWLGPQTPAEQIARIGDAKEAEYRRLALERGLTPLPGAARWLQRLHQRGWKQAIASSPPPPPSACRPTGASSSRTPPSASRRRAAPGSE